MVRQRTSRPAPLALGALVLTVSLVSPVARAAATGPVPVPPKQAVAVGSGGAVATVDRYATAVGLDVLRHGGNAVDAAVATAATLGVTQPFSAGIGGGGFLLYYDPRAREVRTIDGRETAPARMTSRAFLDPSGKPLPFDQAVNSGLSVGVPGTPALWQRALRAWGTEDLAQALAPAARIARQGFRVERDFRAEIEMNRDRFADVGPTAALYLPGGQPPAVGATFRNPDLARSYDLLARDGVAALYHGALGQDLLRAVAHPPVVPGAHRLFRPGLMSAADLAGYRAIDRDPTHSTYHGLDLYGMAPPSSGGTTVGEALNILARFHLSAADRTQALQHYLEASRIAFADRNRWVGDPSRVRVPEQGLLDPAFAACRAQLISSTTTLRSPVPPGDPAAGGRCLGPGATPSDSPHEGLSTTHLVVTDRWGGVVSYTLTIEQTGGSAIVVPHRGFLLNNELTDFDFAPISPHAPDPNLPDGGKRPRSSMAPTIVLRDGVPRYALGSPGGASIITTVLQILVNRLDLGMTLPQAIAAPRISQRDRATTEAEPAFLGSSQDAALTKLGQRFVLAPPAFTPTPEIGAATGLEFCGCGRVQAVAEPRRRSGGAAGVVRPERVKPGRAA
jgi:gamma-glutamyltranspeptidase/glutathione hydrolase